MNDAEGGLAIAEVSVDGGLWDVCVHLEKVMSPLLGAASICFSVYLLTSRVSKMPL